MLNVYVNKNFQGPRLTEDDHLKLTADIVNSKRGNIVVNVRHSLDLQPFQRTNATIVNFSTHQEREIQRKHWDGRTVFTITDGAAVVHATVPVQDTVAVQVIAAVKDTVVVQDSILQPVLCAHIDRDFQGLSLTPAEHFQLTADLVNAKKNLRNINVTVRHSLDLHPWQQAQFQTVTFATDDEYRMQSKHWSSKYRPSLTRY